jgi:hypothetical protein
MVIVVGCCYTASAGNVELLREALLGAAEGEVYIYIYIYINPHTIITVCFVWGVCL